MKTRRPHRGRTMVAAALATVVALMAGACTSEPEVVEVTVTTTPGAPAPSDASQPTGASQNSTPQDNAGSAPSEAPAQSTAEPAPSTTQRQLADAIRVTTKPEFGSKGIAPSEPITITVFNGKLSKMEVTGNDGSTVKGKIADDKATFTVNDRLSYGTTYTFKGEAVAPDKSVKEIAGKLTTVKPKNTVLAQVNLKEGATYGVGAPIIVTFYQTITDKAAAQRALEVTTDKGKVEGSWGWVQDEDFQGAGHPQSQVHFRPKEYWPANTKVTLKAKLRGVNLGNGWGREDINRSFNIGRKLVIEAKVESHFLVVWKDGKIIEQYPVSYGKSGEFDPAKPERDRRTVSGTHIVQEKYDVFKMSNPEFGYFDLPEKWAIRINNNGEFIHHNEAVEKAGLLGRENVSHGCINMGEADAKELYDMVVYGDPVEVSGTGREMGPADYIYDWAYSYDEWKTLSAL